MKFGLIATLTGIFYTILVIPLSIRGVLAIEPLPVTPVAPGIYIYRGSHETFTPDNSGLISNIGFIVGDNAIAVIDTGGSTVAGRRLKASIRAVSDLPIRYVINTHMHPDHIFGNGAFSGPETMFVGHQKLPRALAARGAFYLQTNSRLLGEKTIADVEIIPPTVMVSEKYSIDLGGRVLELTAHPTGHTDNDLTIFDRKTETLWLGDLLFAGHTPAIDGSIKGWLSVMETLKTVKAKRVVPGHGPASLPWPQGAREQERYLRLILSEVRAFIQDGRTLAEAAEKVGQTEKASWALFDEFNARNVSTAFAELEWE